MQHFNYCDNMYEYTSNENLHILQLIQNSVCWAFLLADMYSHIEDLHRDLGLPTLKQRRGLHLDCLCHKNRFFNEYASLAHSCVPVMLDTGWVTLSLTNRTLHVPRRKTNCGKRGISSRDLVFWNSVHNDVSIIENFNSFKCQLQLLIAEIYENHLT